MIVLDRLLGQVHLLADLAVGEGLGDEVEEAPLLVGEPGQLVVVVAVAEAVEDPGGSDPTERPRIVG